MDDVPKRWWTAAVGALEPKLVVMFYLLLSDDIRIFETVENLIDPSM